MTSQHTFELVPHGSIQTLADRGAIDQFSQAFAAIAPAGTTLTMLREGASHVYITVPGVTFAEADRIAFKLSDAVAARRRHVEEGLSLAATKHAAELVVQNNVSVGDSTTAGTQPDAVAQVLTTALAEGEWIAMSVRRPTSTEAKRNRAVQVHRGRRTHHSLNKGVVVARVMAGSDSMDRAKSNAMEYIGAMSGIDVNAQAISRGGPSRRIAAVVGVVVAAIAAAVVAPDALSSVGISPRFMFASWWPVAPIAAAVVGGAAAVYAAVSRARSERRMLGVGLVPQATKTMLRWRAPQQKKTTTDKEGNVTETPEYEGDYPLCRTGILMSAPLAVMIATPHAGSSFESAGTASRQAPVALRSAVGPVVGRDEFSPVRIGAEERWEGTFLVGAPGSGKSRLLEAIWGFYALTMDRDESTIMPSFTAAAGASSDVSDAPRPGRRRTLGAAAPSLQKEPESNAYVAPERLSDADEYGRRKAAAARAAIDGLPRRTTMIAFDTKGDAMSTAALAAWTERFGIEPVVVNVADQSEPSGIELFPLPDGVTVTAPAYASSVVDALAYVFGDDLIGPRSRDSMLAVFEAAVTFYQRPDLVPAETDNLRGTSPWAFANTLIGNEGPDRAKALADAMFQAASDHPDDAALEHAAMLLHPSYGPSVTDAKRRDLFDAPRTKIGPMLRTAAWWQRPNRATWRELLVSGMPIILNFGVAPSGDVLQSTEGQYLAALTLYALQAAIQRECVGWQKQGYAVGVFADEVKHIASETNTEIISWLRSDGRSFGVFCAFATQFPEQLPPKVRETLLGFVTIVAFTQQAQAIRESVAQAVSGGGVSWTGDDVEQLPRYTGIVKTRFGGKSQPGFTTPIPDFESMSTEEFVGMTMESSSVDPAVAR